MRYIFPKNFIYHHGVKGQKWGIRRTPEELGRHVHFRRSKMSMEEYIHACDLWRKYAEIDYWPDPKNRVLSSLTNNLTADEKESSIVSINYNNHHYTAINKGYEQYKVVRAYRISGAYDGWMDEIMSEVIGDDWRKYDE